MPQITSVHNPRVKSALKLRDRRHRDKQGRTLIDGVRELSRAVAAGVRLTEIFVCEPLCRGDEARQLLSGLASTGATIYSVTEAVFGALAFGQRSEGALGVAMTPGATLDALQLPECPLVAVLEGVEKPGNVGAVLRSADGAGVSALVVADARTDLYNPNAIRASLGTIFTVPVATDAASDTLEWLRQQRLVVYAARVEGGILYTAADFRGPSAIVLGSEAQGLSPVWSESDVTAVGLPMCGKADSLNVSAAAAVLFYEALRQRSGAS